MVCTILLKCHMPLNKTQPTSGENEIKNLLLVLSLFTSLYVTCKTLTFIVFVSLSLLLYLMNFLKQKMNSV